MDRLNAMRLYCRIYEVGQLSIAAEQLGLSKGAVSKQLAKLETYLGGRLLHRTTRNLAPTEVGIVFYERAKQILESVEEAECVVSGLSSEPQGTLKINAPMSFGIQYLAKFLSQFQAMYPKVEIDITLHDREIDLIEEGYDIALRIATLRDSSLIARRLASCEIVTCASPEYLRLHGEPNSPDELKNHHCIAYTYSNSGKHWVFKNEQGEKQQALIQSKLSANNGNLICDAVVHGMGIAPLPTFIAGDALRQGKAKIILKDWGIESADISLIYPSSKHLSAKVRAFVDSAVEYFKVEEGGVNEWDRGL